MSLRIGDLTVLNVLIWKAFVQSYIEKPVSSLIFAHQCNMGSYGRTKHHYGLNSTSQCYIMEQMGGDLYRRIFFGYRGVQTVEEVDCRVSVKDASIQVD
ncbi:hypothetical protein TNCV_3257171 [Trichonephila clavipes]|nr:hypothetical protein TNCV_3257171 [Trichonephila clavipes]